MRRLPTCDARRESSLYILLTEREDVEELAIVVARSPIVVRESCSHGVDDFDGGEGGVAQGLARGSIGGEGTQEDNSFRNLDETVGHGGDDVGRRLAGGVKGGVGLRTARDGHQHFENSVRKDAEQVQGEQFGHRNDCGASCKERGRVGGHLGVGDAVVVASGPTAVGNITVAMTTDAIDKNTEEENEENEAAMEHQQLDEEGPDLNQDPKDVCVLAERAHTRSD